LVAIVLLGGCSSGGQAAPAAVVGGEPISGHEVDRLSGELAASQRQAAASPIGPDGGRRPLPEQRLHQLVLAQLIKAKVVAELATQEGVTSRADEMARTASGQLAETEFSDTGWGRADFETAVRSSLLSKALAEKLFPTVDVAEDAMRAYFDAHPDLFQPKWKATVDLAFFKTQADAQRLTATAGAAARFEALARQAGAVDVLAAQAVDQASPLPPEILTAIGALPAQMLSAPIPVPKGWWVVHADEVSTMAAQSFDASRPSIRDHLADQDRQTRFAGWLSEKVRAADVRVNRRFGRWPDDFLL
jgi:parvulin-like peptidyl-prolyl isomerase